MSLQVYLAYTFSAPLGATKLHINIFFKVLGKYVCIVLWPPTMPNIPEWTSLLLTHKY